MPNADLRRELPRRRNSGSPTSENSENANFALMEFSKVRACSTPVSGGAASDGPLPFGRYNQEAA